MDQAQPLRNIIKRAQMMPPVEKGARVIAVTSGKGGVGKSSVTTNLAVQLTKLGKKVIIFDADFGLANVEVMFGQMPNFTLSDVIFKGKSITEIITRGPMDIGFISGGSGVVAMNNLDDSQRALLIKNLSDLDSMADVILIDTAAGVSSSVLDFVSSCPEVVLITTPDPSSLTDAYSLVKALTIDQESDAPVKSVVKVVTNRVRSKEEGDNVFMKLNTVSRRFLGTELEYLGMIPQDAYMEKAVRQQKPVSMAYPDAKAAVSLENIAAKLVNVPAVTHTRKGLSYLISRLMSPKGR